MKVGEAFVEVRPESRGFGGQLQGQLQGPVAGAGAALARTLGAALAGGKAVEFLRSAVDEASNLNEAVSLTGVTFRGAGDEILAMGEGSAESLGLANSEALNFANSIGGLFVGLGSTRGEAADLSQDVLGLAADLASAKNLSGGTAEALERLRSGIVGEVEPLRQLGISFNAAQVEQRALADTGKESASSLTEGEKAAARYAIILEQLTRQGVVGDFARTAEGAANQQRIANAEFTNGKAALGQQLLPAYIDLIHAFRDGIPLLSLVGNSLASGAEGASLMAGAVAPLVGLVTDLDSGLEGLTGGGTNLASLTPALGNLVQIVEAAKRTFSTGIDIGPVHIDSDGAGALEDFEDGANGVRDAMAALNLEFGGDNRVSIEEWASAVGGEAANSGRTFQQVLDDLGISGDFANEILRQLGPLGDNAGAALGTLFTEQERVSDSAERTSLDDQAEALSRIADEADAAVDSLEALYGLQQTLDETVTDLHASADALTDSLAENGRTFTNTTDAGRANLAAARANATAIRDYTVSLRSNGASAEQAQQANRFLTEGLRRQLIAAGLSAAETDRLIEVYGRVPRNVLTKLDADDGPARAGVDAAVGYAVGNWAGRTFTATLGLNTGAAAAALGGFESSLPGGAVVESAAAPTVNVNVYPQALVGTVDELVDVVTPAVAGEVMRAMRES